MRKPAFLNGDRAARLMVSLLFGTGILLPLIIMFGAGGGLTGAYILFAITVLIVTACGASKRGRMILIALLAAMAGVQLIMPNMGFFGDSIEAFKAIALYFNNVQSASAIFSRQISTMLAVLIALLSCAFTNREVGFMPAATMVVITLFGVWSLGRQELLWYALPSLVAILLLISQASHGKINLFEVLPMAALVVVLGMLLMPRGQVVVPPLYDAAMDLKQTISDYLFFTEPRNVFTLGSYGYYPMGSGKLGGEAAPSEYPVMIAKTERDTLLRAVVKDEYTGRSWRDTSSGKRYLYVNPRWAQHRKSVFLEEMPAQAVRAASPLLDEKAITVQMQNTAASTIFTPVFLRSFSAQNDMVAYFNDASELFITRDLTSGDSYTVFAPVFMGGDAGLGSLIAAAPTEGDPYYRDALANYTALPEHMEKKVFDDLASMTASSGTPYDQACAIMRHLQRYYKYTLTPVAPPENQDFVTYFMYVGKEGYCTYFASAMTVLCRMAGLPARYVEGFMAKPAADGLAYVTGKDAHAWTEVYFEGFGWVPFDPTPAQENMDSQNNNPNPTPTPTPEPEPEPSPEPSPPPDDSPTPEPDNIPPENEPEPPEDDNKNDDPPPPFPWWLLLVLAAIAALWARIAMRSPDRVAAKLDDERDRLFVYGSASYQVLKLMKRSARNGETPLMFARRIDKQRVLPLPILPLWRALALSNYGRSGITSKHTASARDSFHKLHGSLRGINKLRFGLRAAFDKGFYNALDTKLTHEEPKKLYAYSVKPKDGGKRLIRANGRPNDEVFKPKDDNRRKGGRRGGGNDGSGGVSGGITSQTRASTALNREGYTNSRSNHSNDRDSNARGNANRSRGSARQTRASSDPYRETRSADIRNSTETYAQANEPPFDPAPERAYSDTYSESQSEEGYRAYGYDDFDTGSDYYGSAQSSPTEYQDTREQSSSPRSAAPARSRRRGMPRTPQ